MWCENGVVGDWRSPPPLLLQCHGHGHCCREATGLQGGWQWEDPPLPLLHSLPYFPSTSLYLQSCGVHKMRGCRRGAQGFGGGEGQGHEEEKGGAAQEFWQFCNQRICSSLLDMWLDHCHHDRSAGNHNSKHTNARFGEQQLSNSVHFSLIWGENGFFFLLVCRPQRSSKCVHDPALRFSSLQSKAMLMMSDTAPYPESPSLALPLLSLSHPLISREQLICLFLIAF